MNWPADESILRDYWAILFKGSREQARLAFDLTEKKAAFTGLSSGAYIVKVQKKTGEVGYGGTSRRLGITSTYAGFQVDMTQTRASEVAAGGECGNTGKITIKVKNGAGPFIVRAYEVGQTTPAFTSAPITKAGNETPIELTGLKASTTYQIEVTDRVGNAGCSRTEPKGNHSYTTKAAAGSFLLAEPQLEICQPAGPGINPNGSLTVRFDNANGTGPFVVQVVNKDTNEVVIPDTTPIAKSPGATTVRILTPPTGKKIEANKNYKITIRDNGTGCSTTREQKKIYTFSPDRLFVSLAPKCINCNSYDVAFGGIYRYQSDRNLFYPGKYTLRVQPSGGGAPWQVSYTNNNQLSYTTSGSFSIYGANEFRFWEWNRPMIFKIANTINAGDVLTLTYEDCSGNVIPVYTHTVTPVNRAAYPATYVKAEANPGGGGVCPRKAIFKTQFQYNVDSTNGYTSYMGFCNFNNVQGKLQGYSSGTWVDIPTSDVNTTFKFYDETAASTLLLTTTNLSYSKYRVQYAVQGFAYGPGSSCKNFQSIEFANSAISNNLLRDILIPYHPGTPKIAMSDVRTILDAPNRGNVLAIGSGNADLSGLRNFITDANHLKVTLTRVDGQRTMKINATGPWNLRGEYTVTFPKTIELYPSMNGGHDHIYWLTDIPPGDYNVKLEVAGCGSYTDTYRILPPPAVEYDLKTEKKIDCSSGETKGKIVFKGSFGKNTTAGFTQMRIYKDNNPGSTSNSDLHLRIGEEKGVANLVEVPTPDPTKSLMQGEVGNLEPGDYLIGIAADPIWIGWHTIIDNPEAKGYTYGYSASRRGRGIIADNIFYQKFKIDEFNEIDPIVSIGMCDPSNPNTGFVRVELPEGSEPQYPITYTLYKVSGGNRTRAVKADNSQIPQVHIAVRPANLEDAFATFNDVPKLTGGDTYEVKFESGCLDREMQVPDFGSIVTPQVTADLTEACWNKPLVLSVDISESVYNIQWKSEPANALDNVEGAKLRKATLAFNPQMAAKYYVTYSLKTGLGCTTSVPRNTNKLEVPLKVTNFTDAAIGDLSDISETMPTNLCAATATWTAPTITDAAGCGYRLTWEVTKADGTKHTPAADANGNTPATSYNGFQIGENYVEYTVKGKADGGTVGKKRFKVTIVAPHVNVDVTGGFVLRALDSDPIVTQLPKGSRVFYKVVIENKTAQRLGTSGLKITLPDNTNPNFTLPEANDPGLSTSNLGGSVNVSYDAGNPRVLILGNIDGSRLQQNRKVAVYIPIDIKDNADCSQYENACRATLVAKPVLEYSTGNGCAASGTKEGAGAYAEVKNDGARCARMELFCASNVSLTAKGTGYTNYQWFSSSDSGATYSELSGQTAATYAAPGAGYYMVQKKVNCEGVDTVTSEYIRVVASSDSSVDVIKQQASNRGGECEESHLWVSHFLFCSGDNTEQVLRANVYQGGVQWQKANGCTPQTGKPNCLSTTDSCWQTVSTDYSYTVSANTAGNYRLKIGSGACTKAYYFRVMTTGIELALEGTPTPHSSLSLGAANLMASTAGLEYKYTVKRLSDGAILATDAIPVPDPRGSQYIKVPNLQVPSNLNSDNFDITVTPRVGPTNCAATIRVTVPRTDSMTAQVVFTNTWSATLCNQALYKFSIVGGRRNYKYLIYKIDGQYAKPSYGNTTVDNIPDSEYTGNYVPSNPLSNPPDKFDAYIEVPREGRYIFLIKDQDDRVALTNEVTVGQTSKFAVNVQTVDLTCASQNAGKITAKFIDPTVPTPNIKLIKYKTDGTEDTSWPVQTNAAGEFNNLSAGKYRVELSYQHSAVGPIRCTVKKDVEIGSPEPIEASIGIVKDNTCTNNGKFLLKINWVKGGVPGPGGEYSFMSPSGSGNYATDREFYVDGGSDADPKIKVYVKDNRGCIAEFLVMAKKALTKPTLAASAVTYDCAGNGSFSITPTAPTGKTYTYEYSLDGAARQDPSQPNGVINYTALPGRATPYVIKVYYKEPATHPVNQLYKATFGDMERLDSSDGAPAGVVSAASTGVLTAGTHVVTKQLPSSVMYRSETGEGRYYAVHAAPGNSRLYQKEIENVVPLRTLSVKLRYINLGKNGHTRVTAPLNVVVEIENPSGGGTTRYAKPIASATQAESWKEAEVSFDELKTFNQNKTKVRLTIEAADSNIAVGLDNIEVWQPTELCQPGEPISVQVDPNKGFRAAVTQVEPPKCHGGRGKIYVKLFNPKTGHGYTYNIGSGYRSTTLIGTDKIEIEAPIGTQEVFIRMIDPNDNTYCQVSAGEATVVDVPQLEIEELTINPKGCEAPFLTAGATVKVVHGTGPYIVQKKTPADADFVDIPGSDVAWTGGTGDVVGLEDNKSYRFRIKDSNGCLSPEVSRYIPAKIEVTATATGTLCLSPGGQGSILVEVLTGNGSYEFSKDGGTTWVSDPGNPTEYEFDGLSARTAPYMIQVKDRLGCKLQAPIEIVISDALEVGHTSDDAYNCSGAPEENIQVKVKGGKRISGAYRIEWKRGGQASDPTGYNPASDNDGGKVQIDNPGGGATLTYPVKIKQEGTYHFRITDGNGCEQTVTEVVVAEQPAFTLSPALTGSEINCAGSSDGTIGVFNGSTFLPMDTAIDRTKGVAPYTITLYNSNSNGDKLGQLPAAQQNGTGLPEGHYYVELEDAKGCKTHTIVRVTEKAAPSLTHISKTDVSCTSGVSTLGKYKFAFTTTLRGNYRMGLYKSLDADGNPAELALRNDSGGGSMSVAKEDFTAAVSGTYEFTELLPGDYYPAVVNLETGCAVKLPKVTIAGTSLKITQVSATQNPSACNETDVVLEFEDTDGFDMDENQLQLAFYNSNLLLANHTFTTPTFTIIPAAPPVPKKLRATFTVQTGVSYRIVAKYKGCISTIKPESVTEASANIEALRKANLCGAGGEVELDYKLTGATMAGATNWKIYDYPLDIRIPLSASPLDSDNVGTMPSPSTDKRIKKTLPAGLLAENKSYVLVVFDASGCPLGSKDFTTARSPQPLAIETDGVKLIRKASCDVPSNTQSSAQVSIKIKDGVAPFRYTITKSATEPDFEPSSTARLWDKPEVVVTNSREITLDKTLASVVASKKIMPTITPPATSEAWYVHVKDANDCHVSQQIDIEAYDTPTITEVDVENMCVPGTEYTLKVTFSKIGRGQHYYGIRPAGGAASTETTKQPMTIVQEGPNKWIGRIYRVYGEATARELRVYDQNLCESAAATFTFPGRPTYTIDQSKLITCRAGAAGDGEIKVENIAGLITAHNYEYRLVREVSGGDVVVKANTPLAAGTTSLALAISEPGKYRFELIDTAHPSCPFSTTITIRDKVLPILSVQSYTDSKCYNPTVALGETNGGGSVTFLASPGGTTMLPMKFSVKSARYLDDDSAVALDAASLTAYTNIATSNDKITIVDGRKVTIKGLYGDPRGIIYTIEAEAANECKTTTEVKIYGVKELNADMDKAEVTQFKCSADQEMVAKLRLPITAITGGSRVYRFTLLKGGVPVAGNVDLLEPEFSIDDQAGGAYTLRIKDAQYNHCNAKDIDFPADKAIDPFVKVTQVTAAEVQDITCNEGEKVAVTASLAPTPTKDVRITLSLRNAADGAHQTETITVPTGQASVSHTFSDVPMGNYAVVAINEETGCVVYGDTYKVQDPNTFSLTATLDKPVKCYDTATGSITFTLADLDRENSAGADQATEGYSLKITRITEPRTERTVTVAPGSAVIELTDLKYGAYTAEATSTSTGCVTKIPANFTIRQADQPIAVTAALKVPDDCSAEGSGEISVEVTGGVPPFKITLTGDTNGHTQVAPEVYNRWLFTGIPGGDAPGEDYSIRVEDAWGCDVAFAKAQKEVIKPSPIDYDDPVIPMVSCKGVEDAYIKIENARGGAYDDPTANPPTTTYYYELYHAERGAIRPLQTSNEFSNLPAGNYTLVVRDRWNCTKRQEFTIADPPEVKVTKVDGSGLVCYGDTGHVKVNVTGGTATRPPLTPPSTPVELIYTIELVEADTDVVTKTFPDIRTSMLPFTINDLKPGVNYRVRASDGKQCPGISDLFSLLAAPNLNVKTNYEDTCTDNAYDGNVVITFDDATVDYNKVRYSFDGGVTRYAFATGSGTGAEVRVNRSHASIKPSSLPQVVKLYYTDAGTTCEGETNPVVIPVVEKLSIVKDPATQPGLNELRLLGKNGVPDYVFYFNGVHKGNESTYIARIQDPEGVDPSDNKLKKRIEAKVEDSKGCTAEEVFYVDYVDIDIPRFFTPNGDGENDTWAPRNATQYPNILTQIYDRYGRLLKELSRGQSWDGTYNGKALPTGDYWYIITLGEEDDPREFKGHFTLFR